jgi:uncharacterized protein YjbJ (UPF0337 family)
MNWDVIAGDLKQLKGDLRQLKGKVKQQWDKPTEDNLRLGEGKRDESAGKIQEAYRTAKEEVKTQVKSFGSTNNDHRMTDFRKKDSA